MSKNLFITQTGSGLKNAISLASAGDVTWFNTAANWGAGTGQVNPGDTIILNGTISGQLVVQSSGSSTGSPITITFAPNTLLTSTSGFLNGAIYTNALNFVTVDGSGVGIVECTSNGTSGTYRQDSIGVYGANSSYFTVKNLTVRGIYVRASGIEQNGYGSCVRAIGPNASFSYLTVSGCTLSDAYQAVNTDYGSGAVSYIIGNNTMFNCNWGIGCGDRSASATLSGLVINGNNVSRWTNWDDSSGNSFHHNGFFAFANNGLLINPVVYNNTFGPGFGGPYQTSAIYVNGNISGGIYYNNLFVCAPGEYASPGLLVLQSNLTTSYKIENNTFFCGAGNAATINIGGPSAAQKTGTQTITIKNNLGIGNGSGTFIAVYYASGISLISDYNLGYNYTSGLNYVYSNDGAGTFYTWPQWTGLGFDAHGIVSNPLLTSNYHLNAGSPAIGAGTPLTGDFTVDKDGNVRVGAWDIGAYAYLVYALRRMGAHPKFKVLSNF